MWRVTHIIWSLPPVPVESFQTERASQTRSALQRCRSLGFRLPAQGASPGEHRAHSLASTCLNLVKLKFEME